jgi:predicted  nucleic acid-binding Zn-ribbon protein
MSQYNKSPEFAAEPDNRSREDKMKEQVTRMRVHNVVATKRIQELEEALRTATGQVPPESSRLSELRKKLEDEEDQRPKPAPTSAESVTAIRRLNVHVRHLEAELQGLRQKYAHTISREDHQEVVNGLEKVYNGRLKKLKDAQDEKVTMLKAEVQQANRWGKQLSDRHAAIMERNKRLRDNVKKPKEYLTKARGILAKQRLDMEKMMKDMLDEEMALVNVMNCMN